MIDFEKYMTLQISTIYPEKEIPFDLYIFFKDQLLCYLNSGDSISKEKIIKLKEQDIAKFYIKKEDESSYYNFLKNTLDETIKDKNIEDDKKVNLVVGTAETALENMQSEDPSAASYKMTEKAAKSLREVIQSNPHLLKKILGFGKNKGNQNLIKHSLSVCVLSCRLGEMLSLDEKAIDNLGTAALLHDIGVLKLKEEEQSFFNISKNKLSPENNRIYRFHCEDGVRTLMGRSYVNQEILDLVRHHEEDLNGNGPFKHTKLTKSEMILSLVNKYDKKVLVEGLIPKEAYKDIQIKEVGNYDLDIINVFGAMLKNEGILSLE